MSIQKTFAKVIKLGLYGINILMVLPTPSPSREGRERPVFLQIPLKTKKSRCRVNEFI
jgi:hypothetical protein